jgi:hypothetical protein
MRLFFMGVRSALVVEFAFSFEALVAVLQLVGCPIFPVSIVEDSSCP